MAMKIRSKKKAATKPRKRKGKVVVRESVKVRKKGSEKRDTIPTMPTQLPRSAGTIFKVKIKKK